VYQIPKKRLLVAVAVLAALVAGALAYRFFADWRASRARKAPGAAAERSAAPPPAEERPAAAPAEKAPPSTPAPTQPPVPAPEPVTAASEIIAKARTYLGSEAALDAVRSVHFVGTMQEYFGSDPAPVESSVEIIFQKPYQQCIVRKWADKVETTGLDDLEAWLRTEDAKDPSQWRLTLLAPDFVKRLRANTWENLHFFKGLERRGGTVTVLGPATIDGVATVKVAFVHEPGIAFTRYFDQATGRLVLTETDQGGRIRQDGEITTGGLRFHAKEVYLTNGPDTKGQVVPKRMVIMFTRITLNEAFPDDRFAVPQLTPASASAPASPPAQ
jgi:hypothetical protein